MVSHLYELVVDRAARFPSAIAVGGQHGVGWRTLDSRRLIELVDRLAAELAAEGVHEGDRVVFWTPSHWRTPVYLFALWKLGAVVVPFDREISPDVGARTVASVEPRLVLTGYGETPAWRPDGGVLEWWEPGSRGGVNGVSWARPSEELAAIFFTSGTTSNPKGCMITHANLCSQVEALQDRIPLGPGCRLASFLPLSHLFELTVGLLYPLSTGATVHYIPSRRAPDILRVLRQQRVTHMVAVPQLLALMGQTLDRQLRARLPGPAVSVLYAAAERLPLTGRHRLFWFIHRRMGGQLRMFASGGAALPSETQVLWERLGVRVVQGYGTSECSPVVACGVADGSTPLGSVGRPLQGVEVRLGADGELLTRGPNVMRGYWRDPVRTAEVLEDGWYATGDIATIDAHGDITLVGRARELIVLPSGMNVWPQDVEDALRHDPTIMDAAVVAVPRAGGGTTLHAYLLPAAGAHPNDPTPIVARANGGLAPHQRIATASWWPEADFPRTTTLKVRRNLLPQPAVAADASAAEVPLPSATGDIAGIAIAAIAHTPQVRDDQTLSELGLDSLSLVDLAVSLEEKSGRTIEDGDLRLALTVQDVRNIITDGGASADTAAVRGVERISVEQPLWPYTWGRAFRWLSLPLDLLYRIAVTHTTVLGCEHLRGVHEPFVLAGTHHSFTDVALVRHALGRALGRRAVGRLVVSAGAGAFERGGVVVQYGVLALGLYPLRQRAEQERSLRGLALLAQKGNAVLIFPQGRHVDPAQERAGDPAVRFHTGATHLAEALDAMVIPFGLAGTERILPPNADALQGLKVAGIPVSITRGPLAIAFGAPLRPEPDESPSAFTERLQDASFALARQAEQALSRADAHPHQH